MNNLLFFNKKGYPHNFQYNQNSDIWEGKIIFDENSDQTFRTQSLHIFEEVKPINFGINANLLALGYNNNSGLTFAGETTFKNETITNIQKVNDSDEFYSKWIYGTDFHKKFPVGTVISFSGVTGSTYTSDFTDDQFFTVLAVKKNAFLIITNTDNFSFYFNFLSGKTSSLNMISINDYNRNLSGDTFFQNLYTGKKFGIVNSNLNDNVVSVKQSGTTYSYLNELKLNGLKDQLFTLNVKLLTERPKILQNDVKITDNKYLEVGKYAYMLEPETIYTSLGPTTVKKEIIFEDNNGNKLYSGYTFIVDELIRNKYLGTKEIIFKQYYQQSSNINYYQFDNLSVDNQWNTMQFNGVLDINIGDILYLSGTTGATSGFTSSGTTYYMNNRELYISNVVYNTKTNTTILFTPDYIIDEYNCLYLITEKLQLNQTNTVKITSSGTINPFNNQLMKNANCYLTSNIVSFSQTYVSGNTANVNSNTIDAFISKYKSKLYQYGIDAYHTIRNGYDYLSIESLYGANTKYFDVSGYTNGVKITDDFSLSNNGITTKYNIITNEKLINEYTNKNSTDLYKNEVSSQILFNLNNDTDRFGFRLTLNGNQYYIDFHTNTITTINKFIETYNNIFINNGFILSSGSTSSGYTLNIQTDVDIYDLQVMVNILSTYEIIEHQRNRAILLSGNEIRTTYNLFDIGFSTGMIIKISGSTFSQNNKEYNIISLTQNIIGLSYQGVFESENNVFIYGTTREFIRKPRGEYNRDVYLRVYWETPINTEDIDDSIFLYDISGNQLTPYNNDTLLTYIGPKPLIDPAINNVVFLNDEPNKDYSKISNPKYQQTVFDELNFKLEQLDSSTEFDYIPEPLEIFIGYNSPEEGVNSRVLKIERIEKFENSDRLFSFTGYTNSGSSLSTNNFNFYDNVIDFKAPVDFSFIYYGFETDQIIKCYFYDQSKTNQRIFENPYQYKIASVSRNRLLIDTGYTYKNVGIYNSGYTYSSGFTYFTTTGTTFYFNIEVQPVEILHCPMYGQTEIEDIRFKVNLNNLGVQSEDDVYQILYDSDIDDNAIDYTLFNKKRKEMLSTFKDIYDYIGSYKSLINAINYFGYNDLQLYEYYKNIDQSSPMYTKLQKVLIPDIFDNSVEGWNEMDFIAGKFQNQLTWKKTNLFNLSYRITDEDGNNVLIYSLEDVQYKLTKLKNWLRKNIIPISANLLDITGVADSNQTLYQDYDESNQTMKSVVERNSTVVNFTYTATLNFGSDYLITVNFYTMSGATGTTIDNNEVPQSFTAKIKTFYLSGSTILNPTEILIPVQYIKINKNDLKPFSFNINKYVDPYIYIETTTYDNSGNGLGYVNNKLFYFDEPRNHWIVNHNFDLHEMHYWQTTEYIDNTPKKIIENNFITNSTTVSSSVETIVTVNTLNNTYLSQISTNSSNPK